MKFIFKLDERYQTCKGWISAKLGLVLGDSTRGSPRQHVQRLGRLLRRQGDRVASLYEIVVTDSYEFFASQKRRGGLRKAGERQLGLGLWMAASSPSWIVCAASYDASRDAPAEPWSRP